MKISILILFMLSISRFFAITIQVPDNPSSLPLILAAQNIDELEIKIFSNHTQAHSLFLSGKNQILVTGYAVGESFAQRGVPIKMAASCVNSLNYLVTMDSSYSSFAQLKGKKIYFPFQGSPIEKLSLSLVEQEGLNPQEDIKIGYLPFASMIELMRQRKIEAAVMPVSAALQIVDNQNYHLSFALNDKWQVFSGSSFYPQVCLFYAPSIELKPVISKLLIELKKACDLAKNNPQELQFRTAGQLSFNPKIIRQSLDLLSFELLTGKELQAAMEEYFEKTGSKKPPASFYQAD